jgi:hypothetical protein
MGIVWRHEVAAGPAGYLDWTDGRQGVLPMRALPGPEGGRVKAYRKLAREGTLPPVLLWWISGLGGRRRRQRLSQQLREPRSVRRP